MWQDGLKINEARLQVYWKFHQEHMWYSCKLGRLSLGVSSQLLENASAPSGSNSNEIQRDRPPLEYETQICLRFLAQGADHEMSADWLAAGPRGRKNPEPGQRIVLSLSLIVFSSSSSSSSPLLLLFFRLPAPSSSYSTSASQLELLLPLLYFFARSVLEALLVYEFSFFIFRLLVVSSNSSFPGCL